MTKQEGLLRLFLSSAVSISIVFLFSARLFSLLERFTSPQMDRLNSFSNSFDFVAFSFLFFPCSLSLKSSSSLCFLRVAAEFGFSFFGLPIVSVIFLRVGGNDKKTAYESHFHFMTNIALKMSGMEFTLSEVSEVSQVAGRIDLITYIGNYCYIFELKVVDEEVPKSIEKKIKEIKKQVAGKQYSHGVPAITASSAIYQQCVVGLIFSKSRNLVAYTIISSPNKEVLKEKDVLDIVERAATLKVSCQKHITIKRQKEEEPFVEMNQADRWSNELRATQDLYEKMIQAIEGKSKAEAETNRIKAEAKVEIAKLEAKAEAKVEIAKLEANKAEAKVEIAKLEANKAEAKDEITKIKAIRKLEKEGFSPNKICDILTLTPEEWQNITGDEFLK